MTTQTVRDKPIKTSSKYKSTFKFISNLPKAPPDTILENHQKLNVSKSEANKIIKMIPIDNTDNEKSIELSLDEDDVE